MRIGNAKEVAVRLGVTVRRVHQLAEEEVLWLGASGNIDLDQAEEAHGLLRSRSPAGLRDLDYRVERCAREASSVVEKITASSPLGEVQAAAALVDDLDRGLALSAAFSPAHSRPLLKHTRDTVIGRLLSPLLHRIGLDPETVS